MSTTMNASASPHGPHWRGMVSGNCAGIAALSGAPVWAVRLLAVLLLLWHPIVAILGYLAFAVFIRTSRNKWARRWPTLRDRMTPDRMPEPPPMPPLGGLANRFAQLDLRLARLEALASDPDRLLRRRFDRL